MRVPPLPVQILITVIGVFGAAQAFGVSIQTAMQTTLLVGALLVAAATIRRP